MIEVHPGLFVGDQDDYESNVKHQSGWRVVHACKEPYHRQTLGYTGRAAPKSHPEYLMARRGDRLILNLVDADDPRFFAPVIFDTAVAFVNEGLAAGQKVLVHCNQGESRGPGLAMLYLGSSTGTLQRDFELAETTFRVLYPPYRPSPGMRAFLAQQWCNYWGRHVSPS
jgi:predicted protein tyrosine phosphatase